MFEGVQRGNNRNARNTLDDRIAIISLLIRRVKPCGTDMLTIDVSPLTPSVLTKVVGTAWC